MKVSLLVLILFLTSCASQSASWTQWKRCGVAKDDEVWGICQAELHGPEFHQKGWCFRASYCRKKERRILRDLEEIENRTLFCKFGDLQCFINNGFLSRKLIKP